MAKKSKELKLDMDAINNQHIIDVDLNSEMKKAYIDYAMSVIVSRALPDVRDGMKPVHRRILYDMYEANLLYENDLKSLPQLSVTCLVNITLTVTRPYMTQWYVWHRISHLDIRLYKVKVTSVLSTVTRLQLTVIPRRKCLKYRHLCLPILRKIRLTMYLTMMTN